MNIDQKPAAKLREVVFNEDDYYDREKMIPKIDFIIHQLSNEPVCKQCIEDISKLDDDWFQLLDAALVPQMEKMNQWDFYVVGCTKFFIRLREAIKGDSFLYEGDVLRSYRFLKWKAGVKFYLNPLLDSLTKEFYKCYCMVLGKKPIRVKYMEYADELSEAGFQAVRGI